MTAGSEFRARVAAHLELEDSDVMWGALLDEAVSVMDTIERLEARIAQDGDVVPGSRNQPTAHPLLNEVRQQRAALTKMLTTLGITDDGENFNERQRKYAQKRWNK
jgi:hypothetical protein